MDLIAFAKETLTKQGAAGVPLALAALNGDKDEIIRLLAVAPAPQQLVEAEDKLVANLKKENESLRNKYLMASDEASDWRNYYTESEAAHKKAEGRIAELETEMKLLRERETSAEPEECASALKIENKALRETCEAEAAHIMNLLTQLDTTRSELAVMRSDYEQAAAGWDYLGNGVASILGMQWDCDNNSVVEKVAALKKSKEAAWARSNRLQDRVIQLEKGESIGALKTRISDLEAIIVSQNARELFRRGSIRESNSAI